MLPIVLAGVIGLFYRDLPDKVPLYYSLPWGRDRLAPKFELFLIPVIILAIYVVNSIIIAFFRRRSEEFLINVLIVSDFICNLLAIITVSQIIRIIT